MSISLAIPGLSSAETIAERFDTPLGFLRVPVEAGSLAASLRGLQLLPKGADAFDHRGETALRAGDVGGVLTWDLLGSVEQCADIAIRLISDHARESGAVDAIVFRSLSGDDISWTRWQRGRYTTNAAATAIVYRDAAPGERNRSFTDYQRFVMGYVNTASLARDWPKVGTKDAAIGNVLIQPYRQHDGSGHLSIIVDACEDESGRKLYLWVDGYTPARTPVVRTRNPQAKDSVWMTPRQYLQYMDQFGPGSLHRFPGWADSGSLTGH